MPSVFTRIIAGELAARFVWSDRSCVAFLDQHPLRPGHTLVVPRLEVDHWLDLEPDLFGRLMTVSQRIGLAIRQGFRPLRVGMLVAGVEVPHVHVHLVPIQTLANLNFANRDWNPLPAEMDRSAETIRSSLSALGLASPDDPDPAS